MRTGSEPVTARSPLRMRFWLGLWGLIWTGFGTTAFALVGRMGWAIACGVLFLIVLVDLVIVLRHIRQGPHYQPGRDVPPYEPDRDGAGDAVKDRSGDRDRPWMWGPRHRAHGR